MPVLLQNQQGGLACILAALIGCGTWPAILDLSVKDGRHPAHSFLDKVLSNFLFCVVAALTFGQFGESSEDIPQFTTQLPVVSVPHAVMAMAGGSMLMCGNLSMQLAMCSGVPIGIVLAVQGALTVVLGTTINYILQPELSNPALLFPGIGAFAVAVLLSVWTSTTHAREKQQLTDKPKQPDPIVSAAEEGQHIAKPSESPTACEKIKEDSRPASLVCGLLMASMGGLAFGLFVPAFNIAVNDPFGWIQDDAALLTPWTANFFFSLGYAVAAVSATLVRMARPPAGEEKTSLKDYISDSGRGRALAVASGIILAAANTLQFLGGAAAGFAAAGMVQAFPVVGTIWGYVLFGQFKGASRYVLSFLFSMMAVYLLAVVLLALSTM